MDTAEIEKDRRFTWVSQLEMFTACVVKRVGIVFTASGIKYGSSWASFCRFQEARLSGSKSMRLIQILATKL